MARQALTTKEIEAAILVLERMRDNAIRYLEIWDSPEGSVVRYSVGDIGRLQAEINVLYRLRSDECRP